MDWIKQNIPPTAQYGILAVVIISISYFLWVSFEPNEKKALSKAKPIFATYSKVTKLAPLGCPQPREYRLSDFYMASSSYSVFPGAEVYDYVSDTVLPLAIKAGVRLIELDIYSDINDKPVVGLKNQKLGVDYAYNTVPLDACCVSIANNAFNSISSPVSSDPFVLSLMFHTEKTKTINAAAEILKTTCRSHMLDSSYSYSRKNLAVEPICNLQSKLIVVSGGAIKGTLMEELINMSWSTSHLRRMTYTQASQPHDHDELIDYNRNNITMVVPDIGEDLVNNNPQILFTFGCQWIMMNYGSIDSMMELYIGEFQENSIVLKPAALRPLKPKKYKKPTMPDPAVSFQPMKHSSPIYTATV
uniref:PI-PLC Y-box domain-containing protein n=1 Tax=viral metagenome TaxID=1070528 RepID=A0A6C0EP96_9ZZZZ